MLRKISGDSAVLPLNSVILLRSLAIFLVISSHIFKFIPELRPYLSIQSMGVMPTGYFGVGIFIFISGYLLRERYSNPINTKNFYIKRFIRIWPMYIIALLITAFILDASRIDFIVYALLLQCVIPFSSSSLDFFWFIGTIMIYYLLFPIFLSSSSKELIIKSFFIFTILFISHLIFGIIDYRVFEFMPIFMAGLLYRSSNLEKYKFIFLFTPLPFVFMSIFFHNKDLLLLCAIPTLLGACIIAFQASNCIKPIKVLQYISNGAYAAYLFHMPLFYCAYMNRIPILPLIPIIFILSYFIEGFFQGELYSRFNRQYNLVLI